MSDRSIFISTVLTAAAGAVLLSAAPAMAMKKGSSSDTTAAQSNNQADKKFCLSATPSGADTVTGSMLSKRQCLTKDQWAAKGVTFQTK